MELRLLGLTHARRWRLSDGAHVADEAIPAWPRSFRASACAAVAVATMRDVAVAEAYASWILAVDRDAAGRNVTVSVLLPDALRRDGRLVDLVGTALARSGLRPGLLELRFTETALLERGTEALLCLSALRDRGVGLAVDDWGRRYGSLSLLRDVPLTVVRLDPALTHDVEAGGEEEALVGAVVRAAHAMGMQAVAQGVDGAGQVQVLRRLGVDAAIGRLGDAAG